MEKEPFHSGSEVKKYFTVANMKYLFGDDFELTQQALDEMAELVIQKKWNVKTESSKVFSVRINRSNTKEEINEKLKELRRKIEVSFF